MHLETTRAEDALHGESRCDDGAYVFVTGRRDAELSAALKGDRREVGARRALNYIHRMPRRHRADF